jgi:DNA polymerase-3 subunit epsilon
VPPMPVVAALWAGAQRILPEPAPLGGALVEETALLARWLSTAGTRIVEVSDQWASPIHAAGRWAAWAAAARSAKLAAEQQLPDRVAGRADDYDAMLRPTRAAGGVTASA